MNLPIFYFVFVEGPANCTENARWKVHGFWVEIDAEKAGVNIVYAGLWSEDGERL
ncbi:hypothetical protein MIB92_15240 [Aestuariirhabdus sp. Z084]|uniref:hypothetical protein n=1 Tax=Aestuariirhabdus haliotis TaxID=2918751 RepID=UPI00201B3C21|nr:hypothetical protein [Aestuariirhabdus haliotis]MCL6417014.1 hypothetical protein [Aestuariirhabdus haliotis]MCL6421047.1 hypothetical protein [Aestuariirhabdus haliotis]